MKKIIFAAFICVTLTISMSVAMFAADAQVPQATTDPVIDGQMDEIWNSAPYFETSYPGSDTWSEDVNAHGFIKMLWDTDYLYFYVQTYDETISTNPAAVDVTMLFVSLNNSQAATWDEDGGDIYILISPIATMPIITDSDFNITMATDVPGLEYYYNYNEETFIYTCEFKIPVSYLPRFESTLGHVMGLNITWDDDTNDDGTREDFASWQNFDDRHYWTSPMLLNTIEFVAGPEAAAAETPVVADETETTSENPTTADISVIFSLLAAASCVGSVALFRKK